MKLLTIQLHMWFFEAETVCKMEINRNGSNGEWTNILEIYTNILDAFKIYGNVFQVQILYLIIEIFSHALMYVQVFIETGKRGSINKIMTLGVLLIIMLMKSLLSLTMLCAHCEKFYKTIDIAESFCASMMDINLSGEAKRFFKNVRRLKIADFQKLSVCGLVCIDAALPLQLSALVATYTVVLLQVAFI
ncbi:hypothetical protein ABMA28_009477 [Loxostege sticticalis]|uniref:Gustatory receptor n=1 Tax=Loxostege sticticalis TaxID=481309 RepID=A0ABD0SFH5_LOXSC